MANYMEEFRDYNNNIDEYIKDIVYFLIKFSVMMKKLQENLLTMKMK